MSQSSRDRFFVAIARLGTERPGLVIGITLGLVLGSAMLIPSIGISTSRYGLVSEDNEYQSRLVKFFERFGYPDSPILVLEGGSPQDRRTAVDALSAGLQEIPALKDRLLARVGPAEVAEVIMLQQTDVLSMLQQGGEEPKAPAEVIEGGVVGVAEAMAHHLTTFALTLQVQSFSPMGGVSDDQIIEVIEGIENLARASQSSLSGRDRWNELVGSSRDKQKLWHGVDPHGYLAGESGDYHLIAMFPDLPDDEVTKLEPVVAAIREKRDAVLAKLDLPGVTAGLTGVPTLAVDEMYVLRRGIMQSSVATAVGILALFLFAFRSISQTVLAGIPLLVGIVITLGITRLLYGDLNLVTSSFISVLMGLGIDFSVHSLARYNELRRGGLAPVEASVRALAVAGPAILTGALTTALAFLTTKTTEFTAFAELGVITAIGLTVTLAATFIAVPPFIARFKWFHAPAAPEIPGLAKLPIIVGRNPKLLIGLAVLVSAGAIFSLPNLRFNSRYFDFLPAETESAKALVPLETDRSMSPIFASLSADSVEQARKLSEKLRALPEVAAVQSVSDLLPPLDEERREMLDELKGLDRQPDFKKMAAAPISAAALADVTHTFVEAIGKIKFSMQLRGLKPERAEQTERAVIALEKQLRQLPDDGAAVLPGLQRRLSGVLERAWSTAMAVAQRGEYSPEDLPKMLRVRFVSHDLKHLALFAFPSGDVWSRDFAARFTQKLEEIDKGATGFVITTHYHTEMIIAGFERAAGIAAILILIMLMWDFRRLDDALLALLPVTLGWVWMLGVMATLGITFNVANIVVLPLVLGIGIDAGVHIVHRYRESAKLHGGTARLDELLRGTGGAVFLSSITTMAGFAGLTVSDYGAMTSLGVSMVIGIGTCMLACLIILPAVLVLLGRAVTTKAPHKPKCASSAKS